MLTQGKRDTRIDVFKGMLVCAMIFSHMAGLWSFDIGRIASPLIKLVTFSGFMFCFGLVTQIAYFSKPDLDFRRILPAVYRPLLAFYICAVFVSIISLNHALSVSEYLQILTLSKMPNLTEFLPAFSLVILVSVVLIKPLRWVLASPLRFLMICLILLLTTFFPYDWVQTPQIALFVGAPATVVDAFPILQYYIFFLIGLYISYHHLYNARILKGIAVVGSILVPIAVKIFGFPARFPPTIGWIVEGIPLVLLLYWIAAFIDRVGLARRILVPIGENTLIYLVLSNVVLFGLKNVVQHNITLPQAVLFFILMMAAISYITTITRQVKN